MYSDLLDLLLNIINREYINDVYIDACVKDIAVLAKGHLDDLRDFLMYARGVQAFYLDRGQAIPELDALVSILKLSYGEMLNG